jgi:hypothetical protein
VWRETAATASDMYDKLQRYKRRRLFRLPVYDYLLPLKPFMFKIITVALSVLALFFVGQIVLKTTQTPEALAARAKEQAEAAAKRERQNLYWDAVASCRKPIEDAAKYDLRWTDGMTRPMFARDAFNDWVILWGDAAEAQNGFGGWVRINYRCSFNHKTNTPMHRLS